MNPGANQKVFIFEEGNIRINSENINLELMLEDNRSFSSPNRFAVGSSRPSIKANQLNEIEGSFVKVEENQNDNVVIQNQTVIINAKQKPGSGAKNQTNMSQIDLSNYPIALNDKNKLTIAVQNILTDYNFKAENLTIETNIENATLSVNDLPQTSFEVLDTNNLRINFNLNPANIKALSGRRLQFRLKDRERGDSDWYTIKQTFVRIPNIESVKCFNSLASSVSSPSSASNTSSSVNSTNFGNSVNSANSQNSLFCELKGEGLDYISQISTDGGRSWTNSGQVEPTAEGNLMMKIPFLINQKFLQIKLRDYPNTEGLTVTNFIYSNSVKKSASIGNSNNPNKRTDNKIPTSTTPQLTQGGTQINGQIPNQTNKQPLSNRMNQLPSPTNKRPQINSKGGNLKPKIKSVSKTNP